MSAGGLLRWHVRRESTSTLQGSSGKPMRFSGTPPGSVTHLGMYPDQGAALEAAKLGRELLSRGVNRNTDVSALNPDVAMDVLLRLLELANSKIERYELALEVPLSVLELAAERLKAAGHGGTLAVLLKYLASGALAGGGSLLVAVIARGCSNLIAKLKWHAKQGGRDSDEGYTGR